MADDEYSVPGDVVDGVGGRTYSGGTFSGILPNPWSKRRLSTYSTASRSSQVSCTCTCAQINTRQDVSSLEKHQSRMRAETTRQQT